MAEEILLTKDAYEKKHAELEQLKTTGRDNIAEKIKEARSFGDLSENSEYDEALNEQAKMEARISKLEAELKGAKVLDESTINNEIIHLGSKVKIFDEDFEEEEIYQILTESEADPDEGIISDKSAVGKALLGNKAGDTVEVSLPNGAVAKLKILEVLK
ncbi:MAG: transcription elongation factor GreA [Clostridia bacterium]|nr:transcription elongation factor GreA [Clostridia bacterium]